MCLRQIAYFKNIHKTPKKIKNRKAFNIKPLTYKNLEFSGTDSMQGYSIITILQVSFEV